MLRFITYATLIIFLIAVGIFLFIYQNSTEIVFETSNLEASKNANPPKLAPPKPLVNPPNVIRAIYATNWSAGTPSRFNYLIDLIDSTELNAIVIDIKDYSGYIGYETKVADVKNYDAEEIRITDIDSLVRRLHAKNIYVIARVTIFQDPRLALARPDLAVQSSSTGRVWQDRKGLAWMDPASKIVWDYNLAVVRDILNHGFDEVNFDYIRFPSDGDMADAVFPFWDKVTPMADVIKGFFRYLRQELVGVRISADVFGQVTVDYKDLGIGQILENAYEYFDYVAPMVYPSHYVNGFIGLANPAEYPYEVVKYSMDSAFLRLANTTSTSKLRPWLQVFDLGATYSPEMVRKEIQAVYDAASSTPGLLNGFMLWNPSNIYNRRILLAE